MMEDERNVPLMVISENVYARNNSSSSNSDDDTKESSESSLESTPPLSSLVSQEDTITLPPIFETPFRPDLIHKAYVHLDSHSYQPQGRYPMAGMNVVADTNDPPTGRGVARIARAEGGGGGRRGQGAEVASTRGGRQAHPPTSEKQIHKKLNKKENKLAFCSAIAATASADMIISRGHRISEYLEAHSDILPIVVDDSVSGCATAYEITKLLDALCLTDDMDRLARRKARSGRSSLRGRSKKTGKSVLFVTHDSDSRIHKAVGALPGIDAKSTSQISVLDLAPGGSPARLTIFTKSAISQLSQMIKSTHLDILKMSEDGKDESSTTTAPVQEEAGAQ